MNFSRLVDITFFNQVTNTFGGKLKSLMAKDHKPWLTSICAIKSKRITGRVRNFSWNFNWAYNSFMKQTYNINISIGQHMPNYP